MCALPRPASMRAIAASITLSALAAVGAPTFAEAQADGTELDGQARVEAAEAAYDQGVTAFEAGEFSTAAEAFELADQLLPARVAMENAIRAYRRAGMDRRAATVAVALVQRDASARRVARFVREVKANSFEVHVSCDAICDVTLDGDETPYRTFFFAPDEPHFFVATFDTGVREVAPVGAAGEERTYLFERPEMGAADDQSTEDETQRPAIDDADEGSGGGGAIPAWVTLGTAGVALALGGVTLWSGLDTQSAKAAYDADMTIDNLEAGQAKQARTNILLGVTLGTAALTAVLAIFTDWSFGAREDRDGNAADRQDGASALTFGVAPIADGGWFAQVSGNLD